MRYNTSGEIMKIARRLAKPIIESVLRGLVQDISPEDLAQLTNQINELIRRLKLNRSIQPNDTQKILEMIVEWILRRI